MTFYYDENFGVWDDIDDPDVLEFYHQVQRESIWTNCVVCGRAVRLRPQYDKCDSCCTKIERGMDVEWCSPENYESLPMVHSEDLDDLPILDQTPQNFPARFPVENIDDHFDESDIETRFE